MEKLTDGKFMGSQCKINIEAHTQFDIVFARIVDENGISEGYEFKNGTIHSLNFHFPAQYTLTFYFKPDDIPESGFGYFTINSVSDFCWFALLLNSEFTDKLTITYLRPNPITMILKLFDEHDILKNIIKWWKN